MLYRALALELVWAHVFKHAMLYVQVTKAARSVPNPNSHASLVEQVNLNIFNAFDI